MKKEGTGMKKGQVGTGILIVLGVILFAGLLFAVGYGIKYLFLPVKVTTTQIDSAGEIIEKTYDSDNAIYNYEWFKTQYEKIQANRNQVKNTIAALDDFKATYGNNSSQWDYETKQEYNRLNTIKIGLVNQEENLVADYNARAKMANRNIFQDSLPINVDRMLW